MVGCDNPKCEREWFHLGCTDLEIMPGEEESWFCTLCRPRGRLHGVGSRGGARGGAGGRGKRGRGRGRGGTAAASDGRPRTESRRDAELREYLEQHRNIRELRDQLYNDNMSLHMLSFTTYKPAILHYFRKKRQQAIELECQDPDSTQSIRMLNDPTIRITDFDTPMAKVLEKAWKIARETNRPLWIWGNTGLGKTSWVEATLGSLAFRMSGVKCIEKFDFCEWLYIWGDDVNWAVWDIEEMKNFCNKVSNSFYSLS